MAVDKNKQKILVVDDDATMRLIMVKTLAAAGFDAISAEDGAEGMDLFLSESPDMVISDVQMPNKNGYQLCSEIRATPQGKMLPVLMMTGSEGGESVDLAYQAGATDYISKPVNWRVLPYRVRYMLRASQTYTRWESSKSQVVRLGEVLDNSSNEIYFIDGDSFEIIQANNRAALNTGYSLDEMKGMVWTEVQSLVSSSGSERLLTKLIENPRTELQREGLHRRKNGASYPVEGRIYASVESGKTDFVYIAQDISERKKSEQKMHQLAFFDSLTGLPNRELFTNNCKRMLEHGRRKQSKIALLFVDLDNFKYVNDSLGHSAGDELLKQVSDNLLHGVRSGDVVSRGAKSELARFGGDEFALLLDEVESAEQVAQVAERILAELDMPVSVRDREVSSSASIGIAIFPEHGDNVDLLLKNADIAMYEAKRKGRAGYEFYSEAIDARGLEKLEMERDLQSAIEKNEFLLNFQPKIDLHAERVMGVEALLRWNRCGNGFVPPDVFIPMAENNNQIIAIGDWVLTQACRQSRTWIDQGLTPVTMAINLSPKQLSQKDWLRNVAESIDQYQLKPEWLDFEVTETVMMGDMQGALDVLNILKGMGCQVSLDDFGTGYSSLNYLQQLPIDNLKIDKSFIQGINSTADAMGIIDAIIAMSKSMGLKIIAEGIETKDQLDYCQDRGVDVGQGYFFSKPTVAEEVFSFIQAGLPKKATV